MIWSVVTKEEMGSCNDNPTFDYYSKELGCDNVRLAVVDESDKLDFVSNDDIVLLRTSSKQLIESIKERNVRTTAEDFGTYSLALDKKKVAEFLVGKGVRFAQCYSYESVADGRSYFVKPRFGNESKVSNMNVCRSKNDVKKQIDMISVLYGQESVVCDNLEGKEYTVACVRLGDCFYSYPIDIDNPNQKLQKDIEDVLKMESFKICNELNVLHHARIDFRSNKEGKIFAIDVNLIPSLGPNGKWAKCFYASKRSYYDSLKCIIDSATRL